MAAVISRSFRTTVRLVNGPSKKTLISTGPAPKPVQEKRKSPSDSFTLTLRKGRFDVERVEGAILALGAERRNQRQNQNGGPSVAPE